MSEIAASKRTIELISTLTVDDIREINLKEIIHKTKTTGIGFQQNS
jgi:hypothetical protein